MTVLSADDASLIRPTALTTIAPITAGVKSKENRMDFIEEFETSIKLWGDGDIIESLSSSEADDVFEFAETMALITRYHFNQNQQPNENFSFIANSSLSGGRHPCSYPECRLRKLDQLVSFASLYADEVYIQNPFEQVMLKSSENINEVSRQELTHGILNFFRLKPLIEKGIIKYAQNTVSLCQHHKDTLANPISKNIEQKEDKLYELLHEYLINKCAIYFDIGKGAGPFFKIEGPKSLIDHGVMYFHLYEPLPDFVESLKAKKLPYKLSQKEIADYNILSLIISPILRDLSNQEWHSAFHGTSYLCDNEAQMKIASQLNNPVYKANSSSFEKAMKHYLPTIHSKDYNAIVKLRERESEAFAVYRDKINSMIKKQKNWSEVEVSEMFRDQVLPEINIIEKKVKDWKSKSRESLKEKVIFGSGAISVGLYAGLLPPNIGQIIAAIGGGTAVVGAMMDYNKTLKEKEEARSNDFYFLWQAKQ
ncbi:hypothetical protein [Methylomonas sp. 11b]|uniref:hypothetical protein n=1 Tax=Methylomonas sp. 11b TaxID=1168169 RepID=UPI00047B5881|nr:hypothetical protein [Methylomonas sp. 11b]